MFIDTHMHLANQLFDDEFRYISADKDGTYQVNTGNRRRLIEELKTAGMKYGAEAAIDLQSNERIIKLVEENPGFLYPILGLHPKIAAVTSLKQRKIIDKYVLAAPNIVAIGETGLEYHHFEKGKRHKFRQWMFFIHQILLADKLRLPLVLHIRNSREDKEADKDALRILRLFRRRLHGGILHCFQSDISMAKACIELGYHIGIGGAVLQKEERAAELWNVIKSDEVPLERIVLETDSPYILPDTGHSPEFETLSGKQRRKVRNTPLILPEVIWKIAELKGVSVEDAERITTENARKVMRF